MIAPGIDGTLTARADHVARAILIGAQIRTAALHAFRHARFLRIETFRFGGATRINHDTASRRTLRERISIRSVPIGAPFPRIARHIVEAVRVSRKRSHRRDPAKAIVLGIFVRESAFPNVGHPTAVDREIVTPRVACARESAAGGKFPLRFRGQPLARPGRISGGILISDVQDGVLVVAHDRTVRPRRMTPIGAGHVTPPTEGVVERNRGTWR